MTVRTLLDGDLSLTLSVFELSSRIIGSLDKLVLFAGTVQSLRANTPLARFPCCVLLDGLSNDEARVCTCSAANRGFFGNAIAIPQDVGSLLTFCGKTVPANFACS
ncbi:14 kDa proline-rich protein DC2.15-like [Wolffia australiana]